MNDEQIRRTLVIGERILALEGCESAVGGQVSARDPDGRGFWCTAFEYFGQTQPDNVALLDWDMNVLAGRVRLAPAMRMHGAIYTQRCDVHAVVHLHSHYATVLSSLSRPMGMFGVASVLFHGEQAVHADDGVRPHISVVDSIGENRVVWMKNHGALLASQSLEQAIVEAVTLEACARLDLDCTAAGGTEIAAAEVDAGRTSFRPHYITNMWLANLERIRMMEPELVSGAGQPGSA